jgi:hypothetical protein
VSKPLHIVYSKGRSEHHESDTPRQTRWSQKMRQAGLCFCGEPTNGKSLCPAHLKAQALRMRERAA